MPTYGVSGLMTVRFQIEIDAESEEEAEAEVHETSYSTLIDSAELLPDIEIEDTRRVKKPKLAKAK